MIAVGLWISCGGAVYWPELAVVGIGYLLNAGLTIAITTVAATVAHPSTAAIMTLGFTVVPWIVSSPQRFAAASGPTSRFTLVR